MNSAPIYSAELAASVTTIGKLQQELVQLRAAARCYFEQSDLVTLSRGGVEAADRLRQLLNTADAA
jgi:hypothetical protein